MSARKDLQGKIARTYGTLPGYAAHLTPPAPRDVHFKCLSPYEQRVRALEDGGLTRSDAQAVADGEGLDPFDPQENPLPNDREALERFAEYTELDGGE